MTDKNGGLFHQASLYKNCVYEYESRGRPQRWQILFTGKDTKENFDLFKLSTSGHGVAHWCHCQLDTVLFYNF
jgi:20S proteasome alpha/beta subunit